MAKLLIDGTKKSSYNLMTVLSNVISLYVSEEMNDKSDSQDDRPRSGNDSPNSEQVWTEVRS